MAHEQTFATSACGGGFNRSMQHTDRCVSSRSVADEAPHAHLLHGRPEGLDVGAMEARLDAAPDRSTVRSSTYVGPGVLSRTGGIRPPRRTRCCNGADAGRARGDLSRHGRRSVDPLDRCPARTGAIDGQSRAQKEWRSSGLSGERSRPCRLGASASSQVLQTSQGQSLGEARDRQASVAMVARADRRMAQERSSARRELPRVTRDDLPQSLHPGAWRAEEGAPPAPEAYARHAPVPASHAEDRHPRPDRRCRVDQRTPRIGRRSRCARSLGRRSDVRRLTTARSPRWWSGRRATSCSSRLRPRTRRRWSTR